MKFTVTYCEDEDGGFVADCPALHGCVSHGETLAEAETNIKQAIRLWLETMGADAKLRDVHVAQVDVQAA